jgi:hypothetical protein
MLRLNALDCAASASAAPQAIGAKHCTRRKGARHLRWVHDGGAGPKIGNTLKNFLTIHLDTLTPRSSVSLTFFAHRVLA